MIYLNNVSVHEIEIEYRQIADNASCDDLVAMARSHIFLPTNLLSPLGIAFALLRGLRWAINFLLFYITIIQIAPHGDIRAVWRNERIEMGSPEGRPGTKRPIAALIRDTLIRRYNDGRRMLNSADDN